MARQSHLRQLMACSVSMAIWLDGPAPRRSVPGCYSLQDSCPQDLAYYFYAAAYRWMLAVPLYTQLDQ